MRKDKFEWVDHLVIGVAMFLLLAPLVLFGLAIVVLAGREILKTAGVI